MIILGSSGSIGQNALNLCERHGLKVGALACKKSYKTLNKQIEKFSPALVYIEDSNLKSLINHKFVFTKKDGTKSFLKACAAELGGGTLINAFVGFDGLAPSVEAQNLGFRLALANKESLVAGGKFIDTENIAPIDSEHFGLKFLLKESPAIDRLIITASGGAFYGLLGAELENATPEMALKHPNWNMGSKITIDSATMANKLFEVLEAFWLYGLKNIDAYIERTSTIHALIAFRDGSTTAHISNADMRLAIAHALGLGGERILPNFDILSLQNISFKEISTQKYPVFSLKNEVLNNPDLGLIINATNDIMVEKFLNKRAKFTDISQAIFRALDKFSTAKIADLQTAFELNEKVREYIKEIYEK